ncbi:MAG: hypothetical protein U1E26_08070 [Coriobacteriia bacterium]|nr:hypothetical protein [Coriobacteriia bacterium]
MPSQPPIEATQKVKVRPLAEETYGLVPDSEWKQLLKRAKRLSAEATWQASFSTLLLGMAVTAAISLMQFGADKESAKHYWSWFSPVMWAVCAIGAVAGLVLLITSLKTRTGLIEEFEELDQRHFLSVPEVVGDGSSASGAGGQPTLPLPFAIPEDGYVAQTASPPVPYVVEERVVHASFGPGRVVAVKMPYVMVQFDSGGVKKMPAAYAAMKRES